MYDRYRALRTERAGGVLTVTIDNPPVNAITPEIHRELSTIFADIDADEETRVVVLTGAGDTFSAGGDLDNMADRIVNARHDRWLRTAGEAKAIVGGLLRLRKPIIARINGHAIGLGATLAVLCDITVMVETAKIADTHVKVGLVAGDGGALIWPLLIGFPRAKEYLLTGEVLTGRRAAEIGLVNHALPREELDAKVAALAETLAGGAPLAISGTKQAINLVLRAQVESLIEAHFGLETETYLSEDHREAVFAIREKRRPVFKGR